MTPAARSAIIGAVKMVAFCVFFSIIFGLLGSQNDRIRALAYRVQALEGGPHGPRVAP